MSQGVRHNKHDNYFFIRPFAMDGNADSHSFDAKDAGNSRRFAAVLRVVGRDGVSDAQRLCGANNVQRHTTGFTESTGRFSAAAWSFALSAFCLVVCFTPLTKVSGDGLTPLGLRPLTAVPIAPGETPLDSRGRPMVWRPQAKVIRSGDPVSIASAQQDSSPATTFTSSGTSGQANNVPSLGPTQPPGTSATSTTMRPTSVAEALDRRGTVTFRETPLQEVVFLLSDLWQINIVAGESVTGSVSGTFHETPLREVLSAILSASGYGYKQTGNSLIVLPVDQVGTDDPEFVSRTLQIPPSDDPAAVVDAARMLLSERGQMLEVGRQRVLVRDYPDRISQVENLFGNLSPTTPQQAGTSPEPTPSASSTTATADVLGTDSNDEIRIFALQYVEAEQMQESLASILGTDVTVAVYVDENRILVRGNSRSVDLARRAIEQLDRPRPQVRITALIYDVGMSEREALGINWSGGRNLGSATRLSALSDLVTPIEDAAATAVDTTTGAVATTTETVLTKSSSFLFGTSGSKLNVEGLIVALDQTEEAKLLANPSITVGDRRQAEIKIVERLPVQTAQQSVGGAVADIEFEDAGITLTVQPRIADDGTIELNVAPEFSTKVGELNGNPIIDSRNASTVVRVANGETFVLGGLRRRRVVESQAGVPYLKDMKFFGKLFRSHDTEIQESELIVFIRPEMITPNHVGLPREQHAARVTDCLLDSVPYATQCPLTPDCRDPNCPNHYPRPRVNGGSRELEMIGGYGSTMNPMMHGSPTIISERVISESSVPESTVQSPTTWHPSESPDAIPGEMPMDMESASEPMLFEPVIVKEPRR
ncbi:Type II secretion system protein D precursor [Crateriforma conspicua]|uniref:Type II secretion system protein D n=2 Tax=Crateriforma conspicua TaxID=2527996 RepID=A0A5C5YA55_9PLAN|nr:Type II secretion system protein D precursor [Crateriforma conspicua]TWT72260.1 Type II secretion system protein D precursor [Crateriforma conspicua]